MSENQPGVEPSTPPAQEAAAAPAVPDAPKGETDWKAEARKWEQRAKDNSAAADELQKVRDANLSDLEKAQKAATDAQSAAEKATAEAMRLRVAAKHGISDEDADLFLTGSDMETVERQATALAARTSTGPKPDLSQGAKGATATGDPGQQFASFLGAQLSGQG